MPAISLCRDCGAIYSKEHAKAPGHDNFIVVDESEVAVERERIDRANAERVKRGKTTT